MQSGLIKRQTGGQSSQSASMAEREQLALDTIGQNKNHKWLEARRSKLTASHFHEISNSMRRTNKRYEKVRENLRDRLLTQADQTLDHIPAVQYGLTNEPFVFQEVKEYFERIEQKPVVQCGMYLHPKYPFLGASPDGLIGDNCVLEIKCPFSIVDKNKLPPYLHWSASTGMYHLEKKHPYYYQIQGEIMCTDKKYGVLAVYHKNKHRGNRIYMSIITRDQELIDRLEQRLVDFYNEYYKPRLLVVNGFLLDQ